MDSVLDKFVDYYNLKMADCKHQAARNADLVKKLNDQYIITSNLIAELGSSSNQLRRLLTSCVILLDDGELTKRTTEKQIRYNDAAVAKAKGI